MKLLTPFLLISFLFLSCKNGSILKQKSAGKAWEVVIVNDKDNIIKNILSQTAEGLPQDEPMFDVVSIPESKFNSTTKLAHLIIQLHFNTEKYGTTHIKYEENVYAQPQIIAHINAPSVEDLSKSISKISPYIIKLVWQAGIIHAKKELQRIENVEQQKVIKQMFNVEMFVPYDAKASKKGKNFLWLSNNSKQNMQSLCIYTLPFTKQITKKWIVNKRDSVMKINIPGDKKDSYMATHAQSVIIKNDKNGNNNITIARGLWQVEGDFMGGPFVAHYKIDKNNKRIIVAEAFVYAPNNKKRDKLRQYEIALYTIK